MFKFLSHAVFTMGVVLLTCSTRASATDCSPLFTVKDDIVFSVGPEWTEIFHPLELNDAEAERAREYLEFYLEAMEARASSIPLPEIRSKFLTKEGQALFEHLRSEAREWHWTPDALAAAHRAEIAKTEAQLRDGGDLHEIFNELKERYQLKWSHDLPPVDPERRRFYVRQQVNELARQFAALENELAPRAHLTRGAYVSLAKGLGQLLQRSKDLSWRELFRYQVLSGALDTMVKRYFPGSPEHARPSTFSRTLGFAISEHLPEVRKWAQRRSNASTDVPTLDFSSQLERRLERLFEEHGVLPVSMVRDVDWRVLLAVAFLPIRPVAVEPDFDWNHLESSAGYSTQRLAKFQPDDWARGLSRAYFNWYLLLGGVPEREHLARLILHSYRFEQVVNQPILWGKAEDIAQRLYRDEALFTRWGRDVSEEAVAQAIDMLLSRLIANPRMKLAEKDPYLQELLNRFPNAAMSAKLLVHGAEKKTPNGRAPN